MPIIHQAMSLFGQVEVSEVQAVPSWAWTSLLVLAAIALLVLVPTVLGLRHARHNRELEHTERMRALELGHAMPGSEPTVGQPPPIMIGVWVPIVVFGVAFIASQSGRPQQEAWTAAAFVGTTSVICGTILTLKSAPSNVPPPPPPHTGKPQVDPAAFDEIAELHHRS